MATPVTVQWNNSPQLPHRAQLLRPTLTSVLQTFSLSCIFKNKTSSNAETPAFFLKIQHKKYYTTFLCQKAMFQRFYQLSRLTSSKQIQLQNLTHKNTRISIQKTTLWHLTQSNYRSRHQIQRNCHRQPFSLLQRRKDTTAKVRTASPVLYLRPNPES